MFKSEAVGVGGRNYRKMTPYLYSYSFLCTENINWLIRTACYRSLELGMVNSQAKKKGCPGNPAVP